MRYLLNALILLCFFTFLSAPNTAKAEFSLLKKIKSAGSSITKPSRLHGSTRNYTPYLENARHTQHLQYKDKDWYVEDWTSQEDGMSLVKKFYKAEIFHDQKHNQKVGEESLPELVVGPNFYHLSGLDKRRAVTLIDTVYGVTDNSENGAFIVSDWYTKKPIGVFDQHGLLLH